MESLLLFVIITAIIALAQPRDRYSPSNFLQKDTNIQVRGILALLIVYHHLASNFEFPLSEQGLPYGEVVVSLFFFFSGYGIIRQYMTHGSSYLNGFLKKRLLRLLPQFVIIACLLVIISVITNNNFLDVGGVKLVI